MYWSEVVDEAEKRIVDKTKYRVHFGPRYGCRPDTNGLLGETEDVDFVV